jgi:hypothetical protein
VQVKYAKLVNGSVPVRNRTHSNTAAKRESKVYGPNDIDLLAIYCPDTEKCYYVRAAEGTPAAFTLRVTPTKNNQAFGVQWAKDFESL